MAKTSIDCVDCRSEETYPFDPDNFSYKVNGPGIRYEIDLCIQSGDIIWVNGPFRPGEMNDDGVAKTKGFWSALAPGEMFLVDSIYSGAKAITPNGRINRDQSMKSTARARHETVNSKLKQFAILRVEFRHGFHRHGQVFHSIAAICQIEMEVESPLFPVDYDDLRWDPYE